MSGPTALGGVKLDRNIKPFQLESLRVAVLQVRLCTLKHFLRHQYLVGLGNRLGPRGGVYHRADRRQVPMGTAELAKTEFAGVNADAYPKFACIEAIRCNKRLRNSSNRATRALILM